MFRSSPEVVASQYLTQFELGGNKILINSLLNVVESIPTEESLTEPCTLTEDVVSRLLERHIFFHSTEDERAHINKLLMNRETEMRNGELLERLKLSVTNACNLKCEYCFAREVDKKLESRICFMSEETAKKAIDIFKQAVIKSGRKKIDIQFFGGEPLLNWNTIKCATNYANFVFEGIDRTYKINTNGVLLTQDMVRFMKENQFEIVVSLDGLETTNDLTRKDKKNNGTFSKIEDAVILCKETDLSCELCVTLTNYNKNQLNEIIDFAKQNGVRRVDINRLYGYSKEIEKLSTMNPIEKADLIFNAWFYGRKNGVLVGEKFLKKVIGLFEGKIKPGVSSYCQRMGGEFNVDSFGDVYPCSQITVKYGNVEDFNLEKVLFSKPYECVSMRVASQIASCRGCEIEGLCAGGCAGVSSFGTGNLYVPEKTECLFRKRLFSNYIKFLENGK